MYREGHWDLQSAARWSEAQVWHLEVWSWVGDVLWISALKTCGIWYRLPVDGIRIELMVWWCGRKRTHTGTDVMISVISRSPPTWAPLRQELFLNPKQYHIVLFICLDFAVPAVLRGGPCTNLNRPLRGSGRHLSLVFFVPPVPFPFTQAPRIGGEKLQMPL